MDNLWLLDFLEKKLGSEVEPRDFYRGIFGDTLQERGTVGDGKCNGVAVEVMPEEEEIRAKRYVLTNDLYILDTLLESDNFIIISPISYIGKSRKSTNARYIYAMAIDLDGVDEEINVIDLFHQIEKVEYLPKPTYIVWSGHGLHLYYQFEEPIPLSSYVSKQLSNLKDDLTNKIWNAYTTTLSNKVQLQSLFQGFRLVGSRTKSGGRTKAFQYGDKITVEYLNKFVSYEKNKAIIPTKKISLEEAKEKYPLWYQKHILGEDSKEKKRGHWTCYRGLYEWWKKKLLAEIKEGHRYYGVMCLAVYAQKAGISREELEADAYNMIYFLDMMTSREGNHFTREDVMAALEIYNDDYYRFPIRSIEKITGIHIEKNKRNYQKQEWHLEDIRTKKVNMKRRGQSFKNPEGRPSKREAVLEWRKMNPDGNVMECILYTGISKSTVYKYWKDIDL